MIFKYQLQIDELLYMGCQLPQLFNPNPYNERNRLEDALINIGFPVSSLKKMVSRAAVF